MAIHSQFLYGEVSSLCAPSTKQEYVQQMLYQFDQENRSWVTKNIKNVFCGVPTNNMEFKMTGSLEKQMNDKWKEKPTLSDSEVLLHYEPP